MDIQVPFLWSECGGGNKEQNKRIKRKTCIFEKYFYSGGGATAAAQTGV